MMSENNVEKSTAFLKQIHIGKLVRERYEEVGITEIRLLRFLKTDTTLETIFSSESLDTDVLLRLSKILEYDFFRLYTQHLILYAPPSAIENKTEKLSKKSTLPVFRKNIYTKEIIEFIVNLIQTKKKTIPEVISEYKIPKTTLYKWLKKYQ